MINALVEQLHLMKPKNEMAQQLKIQMLAEIKKQFEVLEKKPMFAVTTLLDPIGLKNLTTHITLPARTL